jgi:hypothetical protein
MSSLKSIISALLLLIYAQGFAHQLIPHCHEIIAGDLQTTHHRHRHHCHSPADQSDHAHIAHQDHIDAGVFDLILCVLSDLEHHAHHCILEAIVAPKLCKSISASDKAKWIALSFAVLMIPDTDDALEFDPAGWATTRYRAPLLGNCPLRGPPPPSS